VNILKIMQLVTLAMGTIVEVQQTRKDEPGPVKKEEVRAILMSSAGLADAMTKLSITDRKKFDKHLNGMIDDIVGMCKVSKWAA
jgi:hypothetical protein